MDFVGVLEQRFGRLGTSQNKAFVFERAVCICAEVAPALYEPALDTFKQRIPSSVRKELPAFSLINGAQYLLVFCRLCLDPQLYPEERVDQTMLRDLIRYWISNSHHVCNITKVPLCLRHFQSATLLIF
jgi:hypothetical protein